MATMQTRPGEKGFTLIETLMAISIIAIGLLALAALQTTSLSGSTRANKHSMAVLLAENQIEAYKNMPYDSIPSSTVTETGTSLSQWGIYTRTTTVQAGVPFTASTTVTVTVTWQENVTRSVVLQTIIAQTGT